MGSLGTAGFGDRNHTLKVRPPHPQTDKMRVLPLLLVVGAVTARPQQLNEEAEEIEVERKAHPSLITNCITENHREGLDKVRECLKCYENSGDPLSEEGLPKAQACTVEFLPRVNQDCSDSLAALEPDNDELGAIALECFAEVNEIIAAEECLAIGSQENMVETLTDGVICLKEMQSNVTFTINQLFEKQIKKDFEKFKKFMEKKKPRIPKKDPMKDQMMSLISKRHCQLASNTAEEESGCLECFESTKPTESLLPSKSDYVKSLATCSEKHLSPMYDQCTDMMFEMSKDPENNSKTLGQGIFMCYMRVVTRNLVEQCSIQMTSASPENLLSVMECGSYTVFEWIQKNVEFPEIPDYEEDDYGEEYDNEV